MFVNYDYFVSNSNTYKPCFVCMLRFRRLKRILTRIISDYLNFVTKEVGTISCVDCYILEHFLFAHENENC